MFRLKPPASGRWDVEGGKFFTNIGAISLRKFHGNHSPPVGKTPYMVVV